MENNREVPSSSMSRAHVVISGRVQGVFFRAYARDQAQGLKLHGWVQNRHDGKVELMLEGEDAAVREMIAWCHKGPVHACVQDVSVEWENYLGEFMAFNVRF